MERNPGPAERSGLRSAVGCITVPFLLLAAVCLGWGARLSWSDGVLLRDGVAVKGRVTELRHVFGQKTIEGSRRTRYRVTARGRVRRRVEPGETPVSPVVEFRTRTGERHVVVGSVNRSPPAYEVGDEAEVVYDPADPRRADVRFELDDWWFGLALWTLAAAILTAFACVPIVLLATRYRRGVPPGGP